MGIFSVLLAVLTAVVAIILPVWYLVGNNHVTSDGTSDEHLQNERSRSSSGGPKPQSEQPPHIFFVMVDDAGFNDVSWNNDGVYMPTLDKLAREGIILNQHYTLPLCTPSRTAVLTGMYPFHSGDQHSVHVPWAATCSARFHRLLPEKLREVGYKTYALGKWHLGSCHEACTPTHRGFDSFSGYHNGLLEHYNLTCFHRLDWYEDLTLNREDVGIYSTDLITNRVLAKIEEHDPDKPGFFYISYAAPHSPIEVPDHYVTRFPSGLPEIRRKYLGMLYAVDESMKQIVERLEKKHMMERSIIIFLSDNGGEFVGIPAPSSNAPLRGAKLSLYEGGVRTPAFVHAPDMLHARSITDNMIHVTDWHSTILSLAGASAGEKLDGIDQTDMLFKGGESHRTELVYNIDLEKRPLFGESAIRQGDFKLILGFPGLIDGWEQDDTLGFSHLSNILLPGTPPSGEARPASDALGDINYKGILYGNAEAEFAEKVKHHEQLYNLKDDPEERNNIAEKYPAKTAELKARLEELYKEYVPPHPDMGSPSPASGFDQPHDAWEVGWCPPPW